MKIKKYTIDDLDVVKEKLQNFINNSPNIKDEIVEGIGRVYYINDNSYPSVTTVIGKTSDKSWLEKWKQRIGEDEAARITEESAIRGTSMHLLCELYLKNELDLEWAKTQKGYGLFNQLKTLFFKNIKTLIQEIPLWSDKLKIAGRTDNICFYQNVLSVLDFKSSRGDKDESMIEGYFIQSTFYALMLYELTGIYCPQIVIMIGCDNTFPKVFKKETKLYIKKCYEVIEKYYE